MSHLATLNEISSEMRACIRACDASRDACSATVMHCLGMGGEHASPEHIGLLLDCADMCETSSALMLRQSPHHTITCGACAELCKLCADECERLADGDEQMLACAEACRRCMQHCLDMVA